MALIEEDGDEVLRIVADPVTMNLNLNAADQHVVISTGGDQGPVGPPGPQGPEGPVGPRGPVGLRGAQGETGPQGPGGDGAYTDWLAQGNTGTVEDFLATLVSTIPGPQGEQGGQGIQGVPGPKGDKGDKGDKGEPGPEGPEGPAGDGGGIGVYVLEAYSGYTGINTFVHGSGVTPKQGDLGVVTRSTAPSPGINTSTIEFWYYDPQRLLALGSYLYSGDWAKAATSSVTYQHPIHTTSGPPPGYVGEGELWVDRTTGVWHIRENNAWVAMGQ